MQLFHFESKIPNVGDALNPWLFSRLAGDLLDSDATSLLVGIGTILDRRIPSIPDKYVFGSGVRIPKSVSPDGTWRIFAVRGPLSATVLNIHSSFAVTDPALLVSRMVVPESTSPHRIAYVPYFRSALSPEWEQICQEIGLHYVDPRMSVDAFLSQVAAAEIVITEAMHGAIIADSFRKPWVPVQAFSAQHEGNINSFKWTDWCSSVNLAFAPYRLPVLWPPVDRIGVVTRATRMLKARKIRAELRLLVKRMRPVLSGRCTFESKCNLLLERFSALRNCYVTKAGKLRT